MMQLPIHEAVVTVEELPTECEQLLELLRMEIVPLKYWQLLLGEYQKKGDLANFTKLLEASLDPEIQTVDQYMGAAEIGDQVSLLTAAVSHFAIMAVTGNSQEHMSRARQILARSESLVVLDLRNLLAKGYLYMASFLLNKDTEDLGRAMKQFDNVLEESTRQSDLRMKTLARRGRAGVQYMLKSYSKALEEYRQVLRALGSERTDNSIRLAICACQFNLGKVDKALEAVLAALEFDSSDSRAVTVLLSFVPQLHKTNRLSEFHEHIASLVSSLTANLQGHVTSETLAVVAVAALLKGKVVDAERAAKQGVALMSSRAENAGTRQVLELVLGAALHSMGDFSGAMRHYNEARTLHGSMIGLAQCGIEETLKSNNGSIADLLTEVEKVRQKYPVDIEVLKLHSYLTALVSKRQLEVDTLMEKAKAIGAEDDPVLLKLSLNGLLSESDGHSNKAAALEIISKLRTVEGDSAALALTQSVLEDAPLTTTTTTGAVGKYNEGVWHLRRGENLEEAKRLFQETISLCREKQQKSETLAFVLAVLQMRRLDEEVSLSAEDERRLEEDDLYVLVSVQMKMSRGALQETEAIKILQKRKSADPYFMCYLGSLHLSRVQQLPPDHPEEARHLDQAMKFFSKALETNGQCYGAILGIAAVLGYENHKKEALDLLRSLAEAKHAGMECYVQMNLGNIYLEEQLNSTSAANNDRRASKAYETAIKLLLSIPSGSNLKLINKLLSLLGVSHFAGKRFDEAVDAFSDLHARAPENVNTKYNLAVSLLNAGAQILLDKTKQQNLELVDRALYMLRSALRMLQTLPAGGPSQTVAAYVTGHCSYCVQTISQAESWRAKLQELKAVELERLVEAERIRTMREQEQEDKQKEEQEREKTLRMEIEREAELRMEGMRKELLEQGGGDRYTAMEPAVSDGEREVTATEKKPRKERKPKKVLKKRKRAASEESSSSSSSSSSDSSSSSSSSSDSESAKRAQAPVFQEPNHAAVMAELFGDEEDEQTKEQDHKQMMAALFGEEE